MSTPVRCRYDVRAACMSLDDPPTWFAKQQQDHMTAQQAREFAGTDGTTLARVSLRKIAAIIALCSYMDAWQRCRHFLTRTPHVNITQKTLHIKHTTNIHTPTHTPARATVIPAVQVCITQLIQKASSFAPEKKVKAFNRYDWRQRASLTATQALCTCSRTLRPLATPSTPFPYITAPVGAQTMRPAPSRRWQSVSWR